MNVALIINSYEAENGLRAGGIVHAIEVARRWDDVDLTIFAPSAARELFEEALPQVTFVAIPSFGEHLSSKSLRFLGRLAATPLTAGRIRGYDALLVIAPFLPDVIPALLNAPSHTAVQLWHLQDAPWKRPGSLLNNVLAYTNERAGLALAKWFFPVIIVGNSLLRDHAWIACKRVFVTTNGVDHLVGLRRPVDVRGGAVYVGRLHPSKGVEDLLRAWRAMADLGHRRHLTIAGTGEASFIESVRVLARNLGLNDCVEIRIDISEQAKADLLASSDLFVFPSYEEGWGIAVAEAMAFGLPVLSYRLDVFDEVFPRGRYAVPVGDVGALARACVLLYEDRALRARLAREAQELGSDFRWGNAARVERNALESARRVPR